MTAEEFNHFTQALAEALQAQPDVLGLILLGSTAATHHVPDAHSDHDFFVIVSADRAEAYRARLDWLPERSVSILHHYRDTQHGARVIYADGHLLEYAIFTPDELGMSQNHHARVVFDKLGDLSGRLAPTLHAPIIDVERVLSNFYLHVLVGLGRNARGELLAGRQQVQYAAGDVLSLVHALKSPLAAEMVDDRNPWRRVERTHAQEAALISQALQQPTSQAMKVLVQVARNVAGTHPAWNEAVIRSIPDFSV